MEDLRSREPADQATPRIRPRLSRTARNELRGGGEDRGRRRRRRKRRSASARSDFSRGGTSPSEPRRIRIIVSEASRSPSPTPLAPSARRSFLSPLLNAGGGLDAPVTTSVCISRRCREERCAIKPDNFSLQHCKLFGASSPLKLLS